MESPINRDQKGIVITWRGLQKSDTTTSNLCDEFGGSTSLFHAHNQFPERSHWLVTPDQTRNLIRNIIGYASGEDRLKDMLQLFDSLKGVLVIQGHMDVACAIVTKTKGKLLEQ
ncbi:LOW QUALITY PROTEIN: Serine protease family S01A [Phytophthora palmivora]|uniref:Serine protease family S01A n=1 Tax=Phytophthora palmivora TaxID=4796 RepID=A0A2P4WZL5_9STRA|nr:LOW QUALITY PROTEIN: Serine protease family S01A [Phytophthora palmivora]